MFYYPLSSLLIECLILSIVEREDSYGYIVLKNKGNQNVGSPQNHTPQGQPKK